MKNLVRFALIALLALPAGAETFKNVSVVDNNCSRRVASNPDSHTKECALKCAASGFGIITADNQYLKFDKAGNEKVLSEIKSTSKTDHLRVDVSGTVKGDTIQVSSVKVL